MKAKLTVLVDYAGQDASPETVEKLLRELVEYAWQKGHFQDDYNLILTEPRVTVGFLPDGKDPSFPTGKAAPEVKAAAAMVMAEAEAGSGINEGNGILLAARILGVEPDKTFPPPQGWEAALAAKVRAALAE